MPRRFSGRCVGDQAPDGEQLELIGRRGGLLPKRTPRADRKPAGELPVARVLLDTPTRQLDRYFDYLVSQDQSQWAQPGVRVRANLGPKVYDGFLVDRLPNSDHQGNLRYLKGVVSPEPVLDENTRTLIESVAEHYAGTMADVARLAIPPRHAAAERAASQSAVALSAPPDPDRGASLWAGFGSMPSLRASITGRDQAETGVNNPMVASWLASPGQDWAASLAELAATAAGSGRGSVVVVPNSAAIDRLAKACRAVLPKEAVAILRAEDGPQVRYRQFLEICRGARNVVIGTRSAAYAPVANLGLLAIWQDGDDQHAEQRAPYPHAREVLAIRARTNSVALVVGGYTRTPQVQRWLDVGWASELVADPQTHQAVRPRVTTPQALPHADADRDTGARLPMAATRVARAALTEGPVLISVARRGYLPVLACAQCTEPARCWHCGAGLQQTSGHAVAQCSRCAALAGDWSCPECGHRLFRPWSAGVERTAEEVGKAFPSTEVIMVHADRPRPTVSNQPAVIISTPGVEPVADQGYAAVLITDTRLALAVGGLRGPERAARRWFDAAALARPGAPVIVMAKPDQPIVRALVRWDPGWWANRLYQMRQQAGMPPALRAVSASGTANAVADTLADLPGTMLGPVPSTQHPEHVRALLTFPHNRAADVLGQLRARLRVRGAQGQQLPQIVVDPVDPE